MQKLSRRAGRGGKWERNWGRCLVDVEALLRTVAQHGHADGHRLRCLALLCAALLSVLRRPLPSFPSPLCWQPHNSCRGLESQRSADATTATSAAALLATSLHLTCHEILHKNCAPMCTLPPSWHKCVVVLCYQGRVGFDGNPLVCHKFHLHLACERRCRVPQPLCIRPRPFAAEPPAAHGFSKPQRCSRMYGRMHRRMHILRHLSSTLSRKAARPPPNRIMPARKEETALQHFHVLPLAEVRLSVSTPRGQVPG